MTSENSRTRLVRCGNDTALSAVSAPRRLSAGAQPTLITTYLATVDINFATQLACQAEARFDVIERPLEQHRVFLPIVEWLPEHHGIFLPVVSGN